MLPEHDGQQQDAESQYREEPPHKPIAFIRDAFKDADDR
jgi:hypothetical protein